MDPRGKDSPKAGGLPEAVVVRSVPALRDLAVGECTSAHASLEELRRDDHFHPAAGTPERSYRHRILTRSADGDARRANFGCGCAESGGIHSARRQVVDRISAHGDVFHAFAFEEANEFLR